MLVRQTLMSVSHYPASMVVGARTALVAIVVPAQWSGLVLTVI